MYYLLALLYVQGEGGEYGGGDYGGEGTMGGGGIGGGGNVPGEILQRGIF